MTLSAERTDGSHNGILVVISRGWRSGGRLRGRFGLRGLRHLWCHFFLQVGVGEYSNPSVAVVSHHLLHNLPYLFLQFLDKLPRVVFLCLNVAQFLLPDASQLAAFQQFLLYGVNKFDAGRSGNEILALALNVVSLKQCLYDASTRGRSADAVLLQCCTQFLVLNKLSCRFHCSEQCRLGVEFRRRCPFLGERGHVVATLTFYEIRQVALLCVVGIVLAFIAFGFVLVACRLLIYYSPPFVENGFPRHFEIYVLHLSHHRCCGKLAVGIEHCNETAGNEVIDITFHVGEVARWHTGWDNCVVVGDFRRVEHALRLPQHLSSQRRKELAVFLHQSLQCLRTLRIDVVAEILCVNTRIGGEFLLVKSLYDVECLFGTHRVFLVAVNL